MLRPQRHRLDGLSAPEPQRCEPQQGPGGQEHAESDENTLGVPAVRDESFDPRAGGGRDPGDQGADESDDDAAAVDGITGEVPHRGVDVDPAGDGVQDQPDIHRDQRGGEERPHRRNHPDRGNQWLDDQERDHSDEADREVLGEAVESSIRVALDVPGRIHHNANHQGCTEQGECENTLDECAREQRADEDRVEGDGGRLPGLLRVGGVVEDLANTR